MMVLHYVTSNFKDIKALVSIKFHIMPMAQQEQVDSLRLKSDSRDHAHSVPYFWDDSVPTHSMHFTCRLFTRHTGVGVETILTHDSWVKYTMSSEENRTGQNIQ